ncbi:hypothetical protein TNCT_343761 [Trichonephila clavata]|uniref:Uncharacterized protein n=1 Tax=Trichonephila clavata TaxID=2740835 RepID=A0A8X6IWW2_TRICU|nr:hypothetical protein TNCT_343761 [Trichonephila clavata]
MKNENLNGCAPKVPGIIFCSWQSSWWAGASIGEVDGGSKPEETGVIHLWTVVENPKRNSVWDVRGGKGSFDDLIEGDSRSRHPGRLQ